MKISDFKVFDAHFHIIDPRFPLVPNKGYVPERYLARDYLERTEDYNLQGGAVVSGSFQAFDQDYLVNALARLGAGFVGVTQLPHTFSDEEIVELDLAGVRAIRFNMKRGGSEDVKHLETMARRVHELAGWHVEFYVDSLELAELKPLLCSLPAIVIDHLGLSKEGFPTLLELVGCGARVKASGFGRVNFNVAGALREIHSINPEALMFGTDLPSTRAARPYSDSDFKLVINSLGETEAARVFYENAVGFYRSGIQFAADEQQGAGSD
ncbi:MAG: amidohydrolase family protein [Xanthomonadales bacterium]|jgi:predicted TIM-barrel fold metal-dependent hydrolase|nr:amidohydrolase family protein [Xanthomonadales bacterium]